MNCPSPVPLCAVCGCDDTKGVHASRRYRGCGTHPCRLCTSAKIKSSKCNHNTLYCKKFKLSKLTNLDSSKPIDPSSIPSHPQCNTNINSSNANQASYASKVKKGKAPTLVSSSSSSVVSSVDNQLLTHQLNAFKDLLQKQMQYQSKQIGQYDTKFADLSNQFLLLVSTMNDNFTKMAQLMQNPAPIAVASPPPSSQKKQPKAKSNKRSKLVDPHVSSPTPFQPKLYVPSVPVDNSNDKDADFIPVGRRLSGRSHPSSKSIDAQSKAKMNINQHTHNHSTINSRSSSPSFATLNNAFDNLNDDDDDDDVNDDYDNSNYLFET